MSGEQKKPNENKPEVKNEKKPVGSSEKNKPNSKNKNAYKKGNNYKYKEKNNKGKNNFKEKNNSKEKNSFKGNGKGNSQKGAKKPVKREIPEEIKNGFRYHKNSPYNGIVDIRPLKKKLRAEIKQLRSEMPPKEKERLDTKIIGRVCNLWQYRNSDIIFTYVSTGLEIDTKQFIVKALKAGKTVAVPRCVQGTARLMDFYAISGLNDLKKGSFGVLEPKPSKCEKITDFSKGLCIVPALAFDREGYRLGYGKGYYDRFLSEFKGETIGICYNECMLDVLPHGKYDRCVQKIITQSEIIITEDEKPKKEVKK